VENAPRLLKHLHNLNELRADVMCSLCQSRSTRFQSLTHRSPAISHARPTLRKFDENSPVPIQQNRPRLAATFAAHVAAAEKTVVVAFKLCLAAIGVGVYSLP
jgi:hypothetical protein